MKSLLRSCWTRFRYKAPLECCATVTLLLIALGVALAPFDLRSAASGRHSVTRTSASLQDADGVDVDVQFETTIRKTAHRYTETWTLSVVATEVRVRNGWRPYSTSSGITLPGVAPDGVVTSPKLVRRIAVDVKDVFVPEAAQRPDLMLFASAPLTIVHWERIALDGLWLTGVLLFLLMWGLGIRYEIRRRRWARSGACRRCGYDVAGLDVCPECGERRADGVPG